MRVLSALGLAPEYSLTTDEIAKVTDIKYKCLYVLMYRLRDRGLVNSMIVDKKGENGKSYRYSLYWLLADGIAIAKAWHQFLGSLTPRQREKIGCPLPQATPIQRTARKRSAARRWSIQ